MTTTATADVMSLATHNGEITVHNPATGNHRTFRIRTALKGPLKDKRIVSLLVGPDNESDYQGFAFVDGFGEVYCWAKFRGKDGQRSDFERFAAILSHPARFIERGLEIEFSGVCRVCNRKLTDPESIRTGIGPVCAGR